MFRLRIRTILINVALVALVMGPIARHGKRATLERELRARKAQAQLSLATMTMRLDRRGRLAPRTEAELRAEAEFLIGLDRDSGQLGR